MVNFRYYVYVNHTAYDWFITLKEAEEFIENYVFRYPNALCQIKRIRWE